MPIKGEEYFNDIKIIYNRLFDHRAVIQGEIKYIIHEFEEKSLNCMLNKALDQMKEMNSTLIPECITNLDKFNDLNQIISDATKKCYKITDAEAPDKEFIRNQRRERAVEWTIYLDKISEKCKQIDLQYTEDLIKIEEHYKNLESQLQ